MNSDIRIQSHSDNVHSVAAFRDAAVVVQHKIPLTLQLIGDEKMGLPLYVMLEFANSFYFCLSHWG